MVEHKYTVNYKFNKTIIKISGLACDICEKTISHDILQYSIHE